MRIIWHFILLKLLPVFGIILGIISLSQKSNSQLLSPHIVTSIYFLSILCLFPLLFYYVYNVFTKSSISLRAFISLLLLFLFALVLDYIFNTNVFTERKYLREDIFYLCLLIPLLSFFVIKFEHKILLFYDNLLVVASKSADKNIVRDTIIGCLILFLAILNIIFKFEIFGDIIFFIAICFNIYYIMKMLHIDGAMQEVVKNEIYLLFPVVMFVFSTLFLIGSAFYATIILLVINFIVILYFIQQISNGKYGLFNYIMSIFVYYVILSCPFFVMGYVSLDDVREQYVNSALLYPVLFLSISLLVNGLIYSNYKVNHILVFGVNIINRILYMFFLFSSILGAITYYISGGDIFYNTYKITSMVLFSLSRFPFNVVLIGFIGLFLLCIYLYFLFHIIDRFFRSKTFYLINEFKLLKFINFARLSFVFCIIFVSYNIYFIDNIGKKIVNGYFIYDKINNQLQSELSNRKNNMPVLNYSNTTNIPRRNLVIIHLESMDKVNSESQYFNNLMPTLSNFSDVGVSFVENKQIYGQRYSYAGIKMAYCGVITILDDNVKCLGNILHGYGYYQEFIQGWPMSALGFDEIFNTIQYDKMYGYFELKKLFNQNPKLLDNFSKTIKDTGYSYSDSAVFGLAYDEFDRLYANNTQKPFVLTLFTSDNHVYHPTLDEYSCDDSLDKYNGVNSDLLIYQILHCQDDLIRRYVEHIRSVDVNNNTAIIIIGDHLAHYSDNWHTKIDSDDIYFTILNSGYESQKIDYEVGNYDMAPMALDILGILQNQVKNGIDMTHFIQGFDVLLGMQTDEGKEYLRSRKSNF